MTTTSQRKLWDLTPKCQGRRKFAPATFFSTVVGKPVTLDVIREAAKNSSGAYRCEAPAESLPRTLDILDQLGIAYKIFRTSKEADCGSEDPFLPADVNPLAPQGAGVDIDGLHYVVLENNQSPGVHEMTVALPYKENR
jgi:hypothetical protein